MQSPKGHYNSVKTGVLFDEVDPECSRPEQKRVLQSHRRLGSSRKW